MAVSAYPRRTAGPLENLISELTLSALNPTSRGAIAEPRPCRGSNSENIRGPGASFARMAQTATKWVSSTAEGRFDAFRQLSAPKKLATGPSAL